ncbi:MAG: iron ABC transporter permease [Anaerolineales bacterium]|nr:iron ABC transporter permease [Anaerolineales bacterium]MCB8938187.1 iron ABC transporter permease [Ardenticatenaceae bacterium]
MGVTDFGNVNSGVRSLPRLKVELNQSWLRQRHWSPFQWLLIGSAGLVAALILMVPAYLLLRVGTSWAEAWETLSQPRTLEILGNTLGLAAAVTAASTLIAVPLAWLTTSTDLPGKRLWAVIVALPLVVPSYVAAYLFASILTPKGLLQQILYPIFGVERLPSFYGFPGAFLVLTLVSYPFIFLTVRSALKKMDPALVEAARSLGLSPWRAFWRVTLPYLRPSITAGGLLVMLYTLRDFGAVTMLQYSTFTRIIYNRYLGYKLDMAAAMALVLVLATAVILYLEQRSQGKARYARVSIGVARAQTPVKLGRWRWLGLSFTGLLSFWALIVPSLGLAYWFWRGLNQDWAVKSLGAAQTNVESLLSLVEPAWHSLSASLLGAGLAMLLALPIAILVVRRPGRLSRLFERLSYASFALPGIVVALAYVYFGTNYAASLYQTLPMLLIAYVILFIPQAVGAQRSSLLQVSSSLEEAAQSLGKRPSDIFRRITLPLVKPGMLAGAALVFLTCMKELPATLILSPLGFNTLSAEIWSNIGEAFFARAAAPTLLLLLLSSIPLAWMTLREKE